MKPLLDINNLSVSIADKQIISGLNLTLNPGEVHAIMGPNGSGKSTLSKVIARHPEYQVTSGSISFQQNNLFDLSIEECAQQGVFIGFQYPVSIPGVSNIQFLKTAINSIREKQNLPQLDAVDFLKLVKQQMQDLGMPEELLYRGVNDGFSGGEKKRNEILQMAILQPKLAILDETDSGLDIDALKCVANGVNKLRSNDRVILLITHYQRLLDYIEPDKVHVMSKGKLVHSGDKDLPLELENKGYEWLEKIS